MLTKSNKASGLCNVAISIRSVGQWQYRELKRQGSMRGGAVSYCMASLLKVGRWTQKCGGSKRAVKTTKSIAEFRCGNVGQPCSAACTQGPAENFAGQLFWSTSLVSDVGLPPGDYFSGKSLVAGRRRFGGKCQQRAGVDLLVLLMAASIAIC